MSIATVSRVVNGSPRVSEKTKQKVLAVMEENDYTPNVFARGLGLGSMKTVGIICPDISDSYMSKAVSYLESRLHEYGYDCILGCSGFKQKEKENYVNLLLSKKIDTLVLVGSTYAGNGKDEDDTDYIREAAEQTPIFIINGRVCGKNIYCACADDYHATYEVTKSMIRRGRERILFMYDSDSFSGRQKMKGYEAALADAGYPIRGELKFRTKNDIEYTKNLLLEYSRTLEFDGVLATDDAMAAEGRPFVGIIFFGLMLTAEGPKVLEYNARFGDPEAQVVLPRMKTDIIEVMEACVNGTLDKIELEFEDNAAVCVVLASEGYPVKYEKGIPMYGFENFKGKDGYYCFHAGTKFQDGQIVTNGGRVLGITAKGKTLKEARKNAYDATEWIQFANKYMRHDIGKAIDEA